MKDILADGPPTTRLDVRWSRVSTWANGATFSARSLDEFLGHDELPATLERLIIRLGYYGQEAESADSVPSCVGGI